MEQFEQFCPSFEEYCINEGFGNTVKKALAGAMIGSALAGAPTAYANTPNDNVQVSTGEYQDNSNSQIDKDDYWYGPSEVKGITSTFITNGLNNDQEEMQNTFDDYKERYDEHNSIYQYNNNNYGSDIIFGSDDALNKRPYINHQGHTYYKDTNPEEYNYYKTFLDNKIKNGVTAGGYYIPTVTVTPKGNVSGDQRISPMSSAAHHKKSMRKSDYHGGNQHHLVTEK